MSVEEATPKEPPSDTPESEKNPFEDEPDSSSSVSTLEEPTEESLPTLSPTNQEEPSSPQEDRNGDVQPREEKRVPSSFLLPIPHGAKIQKVVPWTLTDGRQGCFATLVVPGQVKELADFYEQALKDRGLQVVRLDRIYESFGMVKIEGTLDQEVVLVDIEKKTSEPEAQVMLYQAK